MVPHGGRARACGRAVLSGRQRITTAKACRRTLPEAVRAGTAWRPSKGIAQAQFNMGKRILLVARACRRIMRRRRGGTAWRPSRGMRGRIKSGHVAVQLWQRRAAGLPRGGAVVPHGGRAGVRAMAQSIVWAVAVLTFGQGVPQDYRRRCDGGAWRPPTATWGIVRGRAQTMRNLGRRCIQFNLGQGVPQDYAESVRWWRTAAEQGHADRRSLIWPPPISRWRRACRRTYQEAARWYRKGAAQGHAPAQLNLGVAYLRGEGVPQDLVFAHKWLNLAGSQGNEQAQEIQAAG